MSLCRADGCQYFSRSDSQDGYCSVCYTRQELRRNNTSEVGIDGIDLHRIELAEELTRCALDDGFNPSSGMESMSITDLYTSIKRYGWKAVDVELTIAGMREANCCDDVPLSVVKLAAVDLQSVLMNPRDHPTAILSWRWDVTNVIDSQEFWKQQSRNLGIAFEKARSVGIEFLFVDAFSLCQYPQVDLDELVVFVELYSRIRVITTFVAEEWSLDPDTFEKREGDSYPLRAWLLIESSRYLNNPNCTLRDLFTIQTAEESQLVEPGTNAENSTKGFQHGVLKYCQQFLRPIRIDESDDSFAWNIKAMPCREEEDLPVTILFSPFDAKTRSSFDRKFCFTHSICEHLAQERNIAAHTKDLLKAATNSLFGTATGKWILTLFDQIVDATEHSLFTFCVLLLFLNRLFPKVSVKCKHSFAEDLICLLLRAGFKIDLLYPVSEDNITAFWLRREGAESCAGVHLLIGKEQHQGIVINSGWYNSDSRESEWTPQLVVGVVERLAGACCLPKTQRECLRKQSEEFLRFESARRLDCQGRKRRAGDEPPS